MIEGLNIEGLNKILNTDNIVFLKANISMRFPRQKTNESIALFACINSFTSHPLSLEGPQFLDNERPWNTRFRKPLNVILKQNYSDWCVQQFQNNSPTWTGNQWKMFFSTGLSRPSGKIWVISSSGLWVISDGNLVAFRIHPLTTLQIQEIIPKI